MCLQQSNSKEVERIPSKIIVHELKDDDASPIQSISKKKKKKKNTHRFKAPTELKVQVCQPIHKHPQKGEEVPSTQSPCTFTIPFMNFVETTYLSDDEDGIELDDELYAHNIQSRLRNIIGSHILTCKTCQAMYKHVLGQQSTLYSVIQTSRKAASPIYTSNDLMQLIKSKCKDKTACEIVKENNGGDESSKLVLTLRLGFGKKQHDDNIAEAYDFIEEDEVIFLLQEPSPVKNIVFPASLFDH